jgi:hypothetical protein
MPALFLQRWYGDVREASTPSTRRRSVTGNKMDRLEMLVQVRLWRPVEL